MVWSIVPSLDKL